MRRIIIVVQNNCIGTVIGTLLRVLQFNLVVTFAAFYCDIWANVVVFAIVAVVIKSTPRFIKIVAVINKIITRAARNHAERAAVCDCVVAWAGIDFNIYAALAEIFAVDHKIISRRGFNSCVVAVIKNFIEVRAAINQSFVIVICNRIRALAAVDCHVIGVVLNWIIIRATGYFYVGFVVCNWVGIFSGIGWNLRAL